MFSNIRSFITDKEAVLAAAAVTWIVQNAANIGLHVDGAALGALTLVVGSLVHVVARSLVTSKATLSESNQPNDNTDI